VLAGDLVLRLAHAYEPLASFPELFAPLRDTLTRMGEVWPLAEITEARDGVVSLLSSAVLARQPAHKVRKAAPSIETLAPAFSVRFTPHADADPDRVRAERRRLRREVARETKSAARELRKDNMFIEGERQRLRAEEDAEYADRIKGIMSTLQGQQHEMKLEKHLKRKEQLKRKDASAKGSRR
jgi:nucleolar protein 14